MKKGGQAVLQFALSAAWAGLFFFSSVSSVFASDIKGSKLATGTEKLINDVTTWLMILSPVVSGVLIIYFFIRRSAADEMDQKKWNNRIVAAIISCIGAVLGSATLNIIIGYYK
ncbi:Mbov_0395 family pilin-like conjugal transfer protein [Paenibacillus terreus]|uniref:Mbov_0395 family pilin-like conjugal transfer protein n=1 Tax=Paenibacillus terreus TaxID=1387834 RepID=A0ABV5BFQ4_9BACL